MKTGIVSNPSLLFNLSHQNTLKERFHFILDTHAKSKENPEHQY
jgi:hypothetical protein